MRASPRPRWRSWQAMPSVAARESSERRLRSGRNWRASRTVHSVGRSSACPVSMRCAASRRPTSKPALCATSTPSPANSRNRGSASAMRGASATMASVMPVSAVTKGWIGRPGLTSVLKLSTSRPSTTRTAPISVMESLGGPPPVVSRSTTTNAWPAIGRARSSLARACHRRASGSKEKRSSEPSRTSRKRVPNSGSRP